MEYGQVLGGGAGSVGFVEEKSQLIERERARVVGGRSYKKTKRKKGSNRLEYKALVRLLDCLFGCLFHDQSQGKQKTEGRAGQVVFRV